ncbi:DUF2997 domain-containing protein [Anatilimnocola floriformis]|uniref:DUF2997 domain-containing protein n=1 Tax=Anatilimnocola floriformis TaxID=2948575 RepID=UPI0020C3E06A|nr:DUF2997 domain-containing protein [Anatilimnocola floriformis]
MTKIIEVTVLPSGETKLETQGFAGTECRDASRCFEQALGVSGQQKFTAEYHQQLRSTQQLREGQH